MGPMDLEFPWARADLEFGGATLTNVGVRFKGNSSFNAARIRTKAACRVGAPTVILQSSGSVASVAGMPFAVPAST